MGTGATDRLFTLESNSTLDDTNGMSLTNTGSIALATGANLTLTFTGSNTGHNTFSPSLGDVGGGYVTSVVVSGTGLWDFSNGSKTYSGNTDVTGGTLQTLTANALSPNSTVVISTGADLDFHEHNQTINALSGNGSVSDSFGSGETFTIGAANGSAAFTGAISGDLSVTKVGTGTQAFSGSNSYTGATTVNRGTLKVDFSAAGGPATNIIPATSPLSLGGGTLQIVGDTVAGSAQTFASTTLSAGGSTISVAPVSGTNLPTLNLGAFTPNVGSELELIGPAYNSNPTGAAAVTVASTGTITTTTLGGQNNLWWPNNRAALSTVGLYDWASVVTTPAGTHSILGGSQVSGFYVTENTAIPGNVDTNYDITGNVTTANNGNGPGFSDTLRFNTANPITVTVGNSDNFYNTGILLTPNVGANNVTFAGTSTMAGNGVSGNPGVIDVYQNDTSGQLLLNTTLGNSNGSAQITNYAQAGAGTVMISGTNTFTGGTYLNGGATEISANANLGLGAAAVNLDGGTLVGNANFAMDNSGSNPRPVVLGSSSGGTLAATTGNTMTVDGVVSGGGPLTIGAAALPGSGAGTANPVAVAGNGTVVLSGQNNYTGVTTLSAGEVNVGSPENPGASGPLGEQAANAAGTIFFAGGTLQYSAVNQFDYSGRFSTASNQPISIDTNGQTVSFNTPLVSSGGTLTKLGGGVLTLKVSDTFTGATNVNGGTLKLDFSAPGAPTGNIVSASSGLALGGGTLQVVGNPVGGNTQTFASTTLNAGTSMIWAAPAAGINLPTVALNALGANYGATVELQGPATINGSGNVTATATVTTTTAGSGANGAIANLGAYGSGAYATVGLYDWASTETSTGGAGTSPYTIIGGSQVANFYQTAGVTTGGNYDVNSSGINTIGNQAGASTVRFNSPDALTLTFTSGTVQDLQGILVTPNIGPNNVNITGGGVEFQRDTGPGAAFGVIWQNNTSGYLNFSSAIEGGRQAGQSNGLVQAGPGTVVYGGQNAYELQTYLNGGYSVVSADSGFGNVSDASTVYLTGGTVVGNASFIMDNAGANLRPFVVGTGGGGLAATTGNTLTIDGVVSGSGPLAIGIGTLPGSGPGTANPTAVVGNGTVVLSGANNYGGGTTINSGTLLANSTDTANGSTGAGLVNITAGGTLGGTGQIRGPISVNGIITAGRAASGVAPGTLTANAPGQRTTLAGGGTYDVKIDSASANGVGGTDWDQLIFGAVAVTATSANPFNLTLNSLNPSDAQGAISGLGSSLWTIATTTSAPTGLTLSGNGTTILAVAGTGAGVPTVTSGDSGIFALNTVGFDLVNSVDPSRGYFALELIDTSGTDYSLDVYYSAPEPGSALLVSAGFAGMLLGRRRRRRMGRGMGRGLELD
jgi:fibronectin-binding autotransporter adhesin